MLCGCWEPNSSPARAESAQQLTISPAPHSEAVSDNIPQLFCTLPGPLFVCLAFLLEDAFSARVWTVCSIGGLLSVVFTGLPVWGILEIIFSVLCDLVSRNQSVGFWCWELDNAGTGITHLCPEPHSETLFPGSYLVRCRPRCPCSEEKKSLFSVFLPVLT